MPVKNPVRKMKREVMTWKKIFVNHNAGQKPHIWNIYKNSQNSKVKQIIQLENGQKDIKKPLSEEGI